jgi:hypothetical protein
MERISDHKVDIYDDERSCNGIPHLKLLWQSMKQEKVRELGVNVAGNWLACEFFI